MIVKSHSVGKAPAAMRDVGSNPRQAIIRIALAQINPVVGDIAGNMAVIEERAHAADRAGADVVVFPELSITGYPPEDLLFKKYFIDTGLAALKKMTGRLTGPAVVVGFVDRDSCGMLYNAAAVLFRRRVVAVYRKMCLPNYGVFDEKRYFTAGDKPLILRTDRGSIAISICEDIWPEHSPYLRAITKASPHILINLSASPYHFHKIEHRNALMKKRARGLKTHLAYCNLVGGQDELVFDGSSLIYGPSGQKTAAGAHFQEDLVLADISAPSSRGGNSFGAGKRAIGECRLLFGPGDPKRKHIKLQNPNPQKPTEEEEVYQALVLGTRDYVRKNGFKKAALGLSGGIDSALVATIAAAAIGSKNIVGVSMPSIFSSAETRADARAVAHNLGMEFMEIPIENLRQMYLETLAGIFAGTQPNETEENLQARIRGNLIMALSNKFGYLVLTTGNKSELATGYCTLYGDMAGGFAVIKDVPKTMVYRLSLYRNGLQNCAKPHPIPLSIINRAPSAELRFNQKDADSLPDYDTLDRVIEYYVENDVAPERICARGYDLELVQKIIRKIDSNEYKRRQGPVGIKITPKAFGRDRRMPITNAFR